MKRAIIALTASIAFISCNQHRSLEARVKSYMADTAVQTFNDPKSYEFVSMKVDTLTGQKFDDHLKSVITKEQEEEKSKKEAEMIQFISDTTGKAETVAIYDRQIAHLQSMIDSISAHPSNPNEVRNYSINVKFRGKNKLGVLVLDELNLKYYPSDDQIRPDQE